MCFMHAHSRRSEPILKKIFFDRLKSDLAAKLCGAFIWTRGSFFFLIFNTEQFEKINVCALLPPGQKKVPFLN